MQLEEIYGLTNKHILEGELPEFEPVERAKSQRQPVYLAAIVDEFMKTTFADMRKLLTQNIETRLSTDDLYKRDCFNRLTLVIRQNKFDNIIDLYDYIQSGKDDMIHTTQMLTQTIAYSPQLVQLMFDGVRQKKWDETDTSAIVDNVSPIDIYDNDEGDIYEVVLSYDDSDEEYDDILYEDDDEDSYDDISYDDSDEDSIDDIPYDDSDDEYDDTSYDDSDDEDNDWINNIAFALFDFTLVSDKHVPNYSSMDVKQIRKAHALSIEEFAQTIDIQQPYTISKWENGKSKPSKQSCKNIQTFLNRRAYNDLDPVYHTPNDIRCIRDTYGVTKSAIAKVTGVSVNIVRSWEYGKNTPSYDQAKALDRFIHELYMAK